MPFDNYFICRCEECPFESPSKSIYLKHLFNHADKNGSKMKCIQCDKTFKSITGLKMHLKQHFEDSLQCVSCAGKCAKYT